MTYSTIILKIWLSNHKSKWLSYQEIVQYVKWKQISFVEPSSFFSHSSHVKFVTWWRSCFSWSRRGYFVELWMRLRWAYLMLHSIGKNFWSFGCRGFRSGHGCKLTPSIPRSTSCCFVFLGVEGNRAVLRARNIDHSWIDTEYLHSHELEVRCGWKGNKTDDEGCLYVEFDNAVKYQFCCTQ